MLARGGSIRDQVSESEAVRRVNIPFGCVLGGEWGWQLMCLLLYPLPLPFPGQPHHHSQLPLPPTAPGSFLALKKQPLQLQASSLRGHGGLGTAEAVEVFPLGGDLPPPPLFPLHFSPIVHLNRRNRGVGEVKARVRVIAWSFAVATLGRLLLPAA